MDIFLQLEFLSQVDVSVCVCMDESERVQNHECTNLERISIIYFTLFAFSDLPLTCKLSCFKNLLRLKSNLCISQQYATAQGSNTIETYS